MRRLLVQLASVALLVTVGVAHATVIPVISGDGTETCTQGPALTTGAPCTVHVLTADNDWIPENPLGRGAKWISYANTSLPGTTFAPAGAGTNNLDGKTVVAIFEEQLFMTVGDVLSLSIWADDTASVTLDGIELIKPCFVSAGFGCVNTPIAFDGARGGTLLYEATSTGVHTLAFGVYQFVGWNTTEGNPFGLLYSGELQRAVPEPATAPLFALGVLALALVGRRGTRRYPLS